MKIKSIFKRSLAVVLALMMLLTSGIVSAVAANVDLAPTGAVNHTGGYVYFLKPSTWTESKVMMFIGHDSYTSVYEMTLVSNTNNLYRYTMPSWGGATYVAFANAGSLWGTGGWGPSNRTNATHYTNVYNNYGFNSGSYYVVTPSGTSNNASISISYEGTSASTINVTARADVYTAATSGGSYSSSGAGGTVKVSGYYMSAYNTASSRSAVSSSASTAYASTTLAPGSKATFTATANAGYAFKGWYASNSSTTALSTSTTYTYDLSSSDYTVYAKFEKEVQNVTATFKDWDGTQIGSVQTIQSGQTPTPPANPTREGYTFTGWNPTVGAITTNTEYTAQYTINSYNITATASPAAGGSVTKTASTVNHGSSVTLTANPDSANSYAFTGWNLTGDYEITSGNTSTTSITLTAYSAITATANFLQTITYTVSASSNIDGAGSVSPTSQEVPEGSAIILTAIPNTGYVFTGWTIVGDYTIQSGTTSSQSFSIIPREDVTATANFRVNSATVKFQTSTGGTVSNSGTHTVTHPNSATSAATANTGYTFNKWEVTGGTLGTDYTMTTDGNSITITPIKDGANLTVTASFTINKYTVTFVDMNDEVIETQQVEYGKSATAPEAPAVTGYTFSKWDKDFSVISDDLTVKAQYTPNTYSVTANVAAGVGGTASTSAPSVTYPNTVTLTAAAQSNYVFNGWDIEGAYEVVEGTTSSTTFVIRPEDDIEATANFVQGQYLTVHSYSVNGYNDLYLWENNGTSAKYPNGEWTGTTQPNTTTFNGVNWKTSNQLELTNGYSTEVGAILNDGGLTIPSGTGNLIMFNNTLGWSNVYLYTSTSDGSLWSNNNNGATTSGRTAVTMNKISGTNYYYAYVSGTIGDTLFVKDKQDNYGNLWETSASYRSDYSSSNPMFTPNTTSNETRNNTVYYSNGSWGSKPTGTLQSDDILLTDYLYDGNTWKGVSEVWIYQNGTTEVVTLRRDLLDLITSMTAEYNGGTNVKGYTDESWTAFVNAYTDAYNKSGAAATTQAQIDTAKAALQTAYDELELQAYYTVNVTQTGATGTVAVGGETIDTATGIAQIAQNKTVSVTVTAPTGYYITSITGAISATNEDSPYTADLTVDGNKTITVTYAPNPEVTVNQSNNDGNVTINGANAPIRVIYGSKPTINVTAPQGYYIQLVQIGGNVLELNTSEGLTAKEYIAPNGVIADTVVTVTYGTRTAYTITVDAYDEKGGKLYYDSEYTQEIPAVGERVTVYTGDNFTVYAKPNDSFAVECWVVDSNSAPAANTYQFTNISANHTISVKWVELEEVSVSIKANPNSVATVTATSGNNTATNTGTNSFTILEGEQVTLTAGTISDTRFKFNGWVIKGDYTVVSGGTGAEEFVIKANESLEITANYTQVYRRIYLENAAGWSQPYIYVWGGSGFTSWPGDKMKDDPSSDYWYFDVPMDITNIQFNDGTNQNQKEFTDVSKNLYNNSTMTSGSYVEPGYYLQGTWNSKNYSAYDQVKFALDTDGNYLVTITVTSTEDGYIYVNPTNEDSHYWNAATANATGNPQNLIATGAYQETPNKVKVEIDTANTDKAYDVTFTFNPTTGYFAWTVAENIPTITIIGTDGRTTDDGQNKADQNIVTDNYRIGDTYFDLNTVLSAEAYKEISEKATAHAGEPVNFYTQVKPTTDGRYIYYVAGWVVNGTEFVHATDLGNGKYLGSYTFTKEENSFVPVYFHTQDWLTANGIETVTVYAVTDLSITNWDTYISAYTWYKVSGVKQYEQFGRYSGQVMIPVTGLDNVYYTIVEYGTKDNIRISGITFNNYATSTQSQEDGGKTNDVIVNSYSNIQTYDYYEFISLLNDGKENITFVIKDTNDTYNSDRVAADTNETLSQFDFVQYTDYSGLKIDIFGNNIEETDATLLDSNALYVIQAGDKNYSGVGNLDGQWYVDCYLYDATGKYLGMCYSYELHDEDAGIWDILGDYEGQRAYFSYEKVNGPRYDGEWYGDADVSVTINLAVNVGLMGNDGYTVDTTDPVNDADYGYANINTTEQNINVERGKTVTLSAKPKTGYKFVGWYSADKTLFSTNISLTVTAAVGTTYTAVFEELDQGKFYVNHYIYDGICDTEGYVPIPNGGNAVLYVGIEKESGESTGLIKGNSASIDVTEGDVLYITIATDATGADTFYSWYTDAFDKEGKTAYEEVGVDSDDNLYDNKGTVIGRNDMVYFKFKYEFKAGDAKSINLYSDLISVSINRVLLYSYTDRYGQAKTVKVPIVLTDEEVEGFAGNNFKPYTPAYITGNGWVNTVQANAPFVDGYYDDIVWVIDDNMFDKETFLLWASQSKKEYTVTIYSDADPDIRTCLYNDIITLDATELFGGKSGKGFWYEDVNGDGLYDENIDKIITYNAFYGYRVTSDICLGYEEIEDEMKFDVTLDAPVYSREQETDKAGNLVDKVYVDYMINIITPHLYGQEGWTEAPIYKGETITDNWNGAHVTLESYVEKTGATLEYGVIVQQFGASISIDKDNSYEDALLTAIDRGYMTGDADDTHLIETLESEAGQIVVDGKVAYKKYEANNHPTNFNRVLFTVYYSNTTANQGKFFNAYGYIKITHADNSVEYHFSNAQYHNIYNTGTSTVPTDV